MRRVELREVSRAYGRAFALHRVSMTMESGTLTALLGGNGAGKTTMLTMLATLEAPTHGQILYDQIPWAKMARKGRQHIGWVGHDPLLYRDLSGRENLRFYATMYGLPEPDALVTRWLERVRMSEAADRRVHTYSRGMIQRLTLARALLHTPQLLLLDEPLTGLDQQGKAVVHEVLAELRAAGCVVVMSTHELHALEGVCTHIAVLKRGKLAAHEPAESLTDILRIYEAHA
jgi:heme exporter protein A